MMTALMSLTDLTSITGVTVQQAPRLSIKMDTRLFMEPMQLILNDIFHDYRCCAISKHVNGVYMLCGAMAVREMVTYHDIVVVTENTAIDLSTKLYVLVVNPDDSDVQLSVMPIDNVELEEEKNYAVPLLCAFLCGLLILLWLFCDVSDVVHSHVEKVHVINKNLFDAIINNS